MSYRFAVCTVKKTPDDGQRKCPKHVEFYSKNKFEKLVHLVGFIVRLYHDARSPESQIIHIILGVFIFQHSTTQKGGTRWRSWLRHCATSRKAAGSIPDGIIGIFH